MHDEIRSESQRLRSIITGNGKRTPQEVIQEITDDTFVADVLDVQDRPVVIDFWTDYCVPCRGIHKAMQALQAELPDVKFGRVDATKNPEIVRAFNLKAVPHVAIILDGEIAAEAIGGRSYAELKEMIASVVKAAKRESA